jgi:hypothetical protein
MLTVFMITMMTFLSSYVGGHQNSSITDFLRDAILGGKELFGQKRETRPMLELPTKDVALETVSWSRIKNLDISDSGGANNGGEYCYVGACCGWGHRLTRQAKTFTHVHFIQNRTMIMEWGPCPNSRGVAGQGRDRNPDFSSILVEDSKDIVNFHSTQCHSRVVKNDDCQKCGAGNEVNGEKWAESIQSIPGFREGVQSPSYLPFQYFARRLLTQLKQGYKARMHRFMVDNFGTSTVIGIHHRHGNGELVRIYSHSHFQHISFI